MSLIYDAFASLSEVLNGALGADVASGQMCLRSTRIVALVVVQAWKIPLFFSPSA